MTSHYMKGRKKEEGQALVEFAIAFPLLLLFILGILQISFIINAYSIVNYAAFSACRCGIVHNANDQQMKLAASISCSPIAGGPALSYLKTSVKKELIESRGTIPATVLKVTVTHRYRLIFPIVDRIFSLMWLSRGDMQSGLYSLSGAVHIPVKATCVMRMER